MRRKTRAERLRVRIYIRGDDEDDDDDDTTRQARTDGGSRLSTATRATTAGGGATTAARRSGRPALPETRRPGAHTRGILYYRTPFRADGGVAGGGGHATPVPNGKAGRDVSSRWGYVCVCARV